MTDTIRADEPTVLMVDDEKEVADAYALRLEGVADVSTAYGGEAGLAAIDDGGPFDVVLLDRHMPGHSGDDILTAIRDRELRTRVIMVTAIDPGLDIIELPFDDYLCKPIERADLRTAVDQQCQILAYELLGEYFQVESKRAVIEAEHPPERLADHDEFQRLEARSERLAARMRRLLPETEEVLATFAGISRETR